MIDIRVLGPMEVVSSGVPVVLGPQQQVLLIVLLLAAGQRVPSIRLAGVLWEAGAENRAPATLRSHVAHLRRVLTGQPAGPHGGTDAAAACLVTYRQGAGTAYALQIGTDQVDAFRFGQLVADGRAALHARQFQTANTLLTAALDMWRGQPLPEVADRAFAVGEISRLRGLHRAACSAWAGVQIELGAYREATGELEAMVARWPEDEGLRRLLAVCLHRSGRVADAARVCRDGIVFALAQGLDTAGMKELQGDLLRRSPRLATEPRGVAPAGEQAG